MKKTNLKKASDDIYELLYAVYKREIKKDVFLKERMKELKTHFKKNKWDIYYSVSLYESKLQDNTMKFNVLLDLIGLEPYYKRDRMSIFIRSKK